MQITIWTAVAMVGMFVAGLVVGWIGRRLFGRDK
jgi:hypothetical protein